MHVFIENNKSYYIITKKEFQFEFLQVNAANSILIECYDTVLVCVQINMQTIVILRKIEVKSKNKPTNLNPKTPDKEDAKAVY